MKAYIKHTILRLLLVTTFAVAVTPTALTQPPPRDPVEGENPVGQSPIGGGLLLLLALGAAYGVVKMRQRNRKSDK